MTGPERCSSDPSLFRYWGKADRSLEKGELWHPLVYHSLDVAAVGEGYLARNTSLRKRLTQFIGMPEKVWISWFRFFLALHDLGKFSFTFQELRPEILRLCRQDPGLNAESKYSLHHSSMGYLLWREALRGMALRESWCGEDAEGDMREILDVWMALSSGHHGQPPDNSDPQYPNSPLRMARYFTAADRQSAEAFVRCVLVQLPPLPLPVTGLEPALLDRMQKASWVLAGIAVLCDWLGSNTRFFTYCTESMPLEKYFESHARRAAEKVLDETGLIPLEISSATGFHALFPSQGKRVPTPLQTAVQQVEVPEGPGLFFLEDLTGSGKTEAALLLGHRLMKAGAANGLVLALPTMATANAMHGRISECYRKLFEEGSNPSISLAHSASGYRLDPGRSDLPAGPQSSSQYSDSDLDASAYCNAWIAEGRKRALLADVGVCTVDQALLSVLPSRHQSLRLLGLSRKVLILDEVHAYDRYMNTLIETLLEFHAGLGGSAILLSATLPGRARRAFSKAFHRGLEAQTAPTQELPTVEPWPPFPLMTSVHGAAYTETTVAATPRVSRQVQVRFIPDVQQAITFLKGFLKRGNCVCWIRNTVTDAIDGYELLKGEITGVEISLFHARFALGDRLDIEQQILDSAGPRSIAAKRKSRIVVATQVVEQSLDLDFDEILIDLAPMDLMLQRAGRLRRHARDAQGNPIEGEDARGPITVHLLSPEPIPNPQADWYSSFFRGAAFVYPNHAQLWLTARKLEEKGGWSVPGDSREMIESVFGENVQAPEGLAASDEKSEGVGKAERSAARMNALNFGRGYQKDEHWSEDTLAPTRLGKPTIQVILARWDGSNLAPWREGEDWHAGELRIQAGPFETETEDEGAEWTEARKLWIERRPDLKYRLIVGMTEAGERQWMGSLPGKGGLRVKVRYSREMGFRLMKGEDDVLE